MRRKITTLFLLLLAASAFSPLHAQCKVKNTCFQGGEELTYDLYFKYGLLYSKAGNATLSVTDVHYNHKEAYRMALVATSVGTAKTFYSLSDTLAAYTTKDIIPLAYTKDAHEKKDYRTERATYNYSSGKVKLRNINKKNGKLRYDTTLVSTNCMYDFISIVYYARTLNYNTMKKGDQVTVSFLSGRKMVNMTIEHHGRESVASSDDLKYNCIKLVLSMNENAFEDKHEAMRVFITDDANRIPIRIESKLKIGTARALLSNYKGQRN